jgi:hypothetical protein
MSLYDIRLADFAVIEADMPFTFTHSTGSGPCVPAGARRNQSLIVGGKLATIQQVLFVRANLFSADPVAKQPISYGAAGSESQYRIAEVKKAGDGAHYELALVGINEL